MRFLLKVKILALALFIASIPAFGMHQGDMRYVGAGEVIPVGSELYDYFDNLFLLCGHSSPSASRPWTTAEARCELSKIDGSSLGGQALELFRTISSAISEKEGPGIFVEASVSPEAYAHSNEGFSLEDDWNYGYVRRNPFGYLGMNAYHQGFFCHMELTYGPSRASASDSFVTLEDYVTGMGKPYQGVGSIEDECGYPGFLKNVRVVSRSSIYGPGLSFNAGGSVDNEVPRAAYLTYAGDGFSIGAYRSQKTWGLSKLGNFVFDDHIDRYNHISAKVFNKRFAFDFTIMFPEPYIGGDNGTEDYGEKRRYFLAHRLDLQIKDNLRLALSENVMYLTHHFADFQYMNPATIFHSNLNSSQFNALAHVELEYSPAARVRLYAQLGIDQGSMPFFEDASKEDQAFGCTLGAEYAIGTSGGGLVDLNMEAVYASPALYRRDAPDFVITNSSQISDGYRGIPFFTYIGFKYGGDTLGCRFDADYRVSSLRLHASQTVLLKGGFGLYDKYTAGMFVGKFMTDGIELISISNARLEYSFQMLEKHPCKAFADICFIHRDSGSDFQLACGIKASFSGRPR